MKQRGVLNSLILIALTQVCLGQNKAIVSVIYDVEYNFDFPVKANSILVFNDSISQYQIFDIENVILKHDLDVMLKLEANSNAEFLQTDISKNKIKFVENILDETFIIQENRKTIDWLITSEKKMIGKFECFKAVGSFRNRSYVVYFCPYIQSAFGPWKLNGLPGLILEAEESNGLIRIFVKQVDVSASNFSFFDFNSSFKTISLREYVELKEDMHNKITELVNLKLPRGVKLEAVTGASNQNKIEIFDESDY